GTYIMTMPETAQTAISSASTMPSQRWTRNVIRRSQRVARTHSGGRGAMREAWGRSPAALEAEAVGGMDGERRAQLGRGIGAAVGIPAGAADAAGVFGVEQVLQPQAEAVAAIAVDEGEGREIDQRVIAVRDAADPAR